jgi:hypothetical protein
MPHAISIALPPAAASPPLRALGAAQGKASDNGREFGELFREQAGPADLPVQNLMDANAKSGADRNSPAPGPNVQAANNTGQPEVPARAEQPKVEPAESASPEGTTQSVTSTQSQAVLRTPLPAAENNDANLPARSPESAQTAESRSESPTKPKETSSASSQQKTKEVHQESQQSATIQDSLPATGQQLVSPILTAAVPAANPAPATVTTEQPAALSDANGRTSTLNIQNSTAGNAAPSQVPAVTPQAHGTPQSNATSPVPSASKDATPSSASTPAESNASSKESPEASSQTLHSSFTPHTVTSAEQGTGGGAITAVASASPSEAHAIQAPSPSIPHPQPIAEPNPVPPAASTTASLYDKIDQGTAPVVLHSGAQHVAVGVRDPDLGWVEIKTQNIAGHVDATLVTPSAQTHASLSAQLPSIAQYLEQRDVRIGTLAAHHEFSGANTGQNGATGNGSGNPGPGYRESRPASVSPVALPISPATTDEDLRPMSYISVRA